VLGPAPASGLDEIGEWGTIPTIESLGLSLTKASLVNDLLFQPILLVTRSISSYNYI
jgi:hypothetical protein